MKPSLIALAAGAFAIGTTEFVIIGLVPGIGRDLGITLPAAGLLVSGYALAVTAGAPTVTASVGASAAPAASGWIDAAVRTRQSLERLRVRLWRDAGGTHHRPAGPSQSGKPSHWYLSIVVSTV